MPVKYEDSVGGGGSGDVSGPGSSIDNAVVLFDGVTGNLIKSSSLILGEGSSFIFDTATPVIFTATEFQIGHENDGATNPLGYNAPTNSAHKFRIAGSQIAIIQNSGVKITSGAAVGSTAPAFEVEVSTNSNLPASTEFNNVIFDMSPAGGQIFDTGAIQTQREVLFTAPTYHAAGASTIFTAATVGVDGPPSAGSNMTFAVATGFHVNAKSVNLGVNGSVFGNLVYQSGLANGQADAGIVAGYGVVSISSVGLGNTTNQVAVACSFYAASIQYSAVTNTRTILKLATSYIGGAPTISGTCAVTEGPYALWVDSDAARFDGRVMNKRWTGTGSAADLVLPDDGQFGVITGTTNIQRISTAGWTPTISICTEYTNTLTIEHGIASGGGFARILCEASTNMVVNNGDIVEFFFNGTDFYASYRRIA